MKIYLIKDMKTCNKSHNSIKKIEVKWEAAIVNNEQVFLENKKATKEAEITNGNKNTFKLFPKIFSCKQPKPKC